MCISNKIFKKCTLRLEMAFTISRTTVRMISRVGRCKSSQMMAFTNSGDPWIDYLITSRLGGCYALHPSFNFFKIEKRKQD
jgi:hypothetical protein